MREPFHGSDADARSTASCTFTAVTTKRRLNSSGACNTRVRHQAGPDGSSSTAWLYIDGDSPELRSVSIWIAFRGTPEGAIIYAPARGVALPWFGRADVKATDNAEWVAIVSIQGKFDLNLTTIRPVRVEGGTSYLLHGDFEIELPGSNVGQGLTLRVSF